MSSKIKLKDVAKMANVGIGTASRVLNNTGYVSDEKRRRVLDAIDLLGYTPDAVARSLKSKVTHMIGVIVMDITNPFYSRVLKGVKTIADKNGYGLVLIDLDWDINRLEKRIIELKQMKVDGLIYMGTPIDDFLFSYFEMAGLPAVFLSTQVAISKPYALPYGMVNIDDEKAAYQVTQALFQKGLFDMVVLSGEPNDDNAMSLRIKGIEKAYKESTHSFRIVYGYHDYKKSYDEIRHVMKKERKPQIIFALSDLMAVASAKAIFDSGYQVPSDVALMGFDGIELSEFFNPSISTVSQPKFEMGALGMETLLTLLSGQPLENTHQTLDYTIKWRESTTT